METAKKRKPRRPRRSKADIEAAIQKAAIYQIKRKGFAGALVTDIVKKAKIEPIVFYNRFKNLDEFYDAFVKRHDFWISDLVHIFNKKINSNRSYAEAMERLLKSLMGDGLMAELLRWEISQGNPITEHTAKLREADFGRIIEQFGNGETPGGVDKAAISAIIIAGLYFMVLHKDRSTFGGIDLNTSEGCERIAGSLRQIAGMLYEQPKQTERAKLEECLRREGLAPDAIARCLNDCCH